MSDDRPTWSSRLGDALGGYVIASVILMLVLGLLFRSGLPNPALQTAPTKLEPNRDDPPAIAETLRKSSDLTSCRSAIDQLNRWLAEHPEQRRKAADPEIWKRLRVSEPELPIVNVSSFNPLDAHYLELTLLLEDSARALDVDPLPPAERARAAFDWVCRQVRLREVPGDPFPPHLVLRRGWGTSLERAVVFCSLVERLGMSGCLVDCPILPAGGRRIWLAGVLADGQVYLFEPRIGVPLLAPSGQVATLEQLRQQPDLLNQLDLGGKQSYDVTAEQAAGAMAQPAGFLTALAPRLQVLQELLASRKVRLASDPQRLIQDFEPLAGKELRLWNFTRLLQVSLPPDQGGNDRPDKEGMTRQRRFDLTLIDGTVFPRELSRVPPESYLGQRIYDAFERPFLNFHIHARSPREMLVRGRLDEATAGFVETIERTVSLRARMENKKGLEDALRQWLMAAGQADAELAAAQQKAEQESAVLRLEQVWKDSQPVQMVLLAGAGESLAIQSDYYLALTKHEQAERAQRHAPEALEAWRNAAERWQKHRADFPGTYPDAQLHQARALAMLGEKEAALALLEHPPAMLDHWNRHAFLIRARRLKEMMGP